MSSNSTCVARRGSAQSVIEATRPPPAATRAAASCSSTLARRIDGSTKRSCGWRASTQASGFRAGWDKYSWRVYAEFRNVLDQNYIATVGVRDVAAADAEILNPGERRSVFVGVQARL